MDREGKCSLRLVVKGFYSATSLLVSVDPTGNGSPRNVTYRINSAGGSWDSADNGVYNIAIESSQVQDTSNNAIASSKLGSFSINIVKSPETGNPGVPGKLLFEGDFENGDIKRDGWMTEKRTSYGSQIVDAPGRAGEHAVRFELRKNDPDVAGSRRSELFLNTIPGNSERWYGLSVMLPNDWKSDPSAEIVTQWHEYPDFDLGENWRSPPLYLAIEGDNWRINNRWDPKAVTKNNNPEPEGKVEKLWQDKYEKGVWTDWVFHVKWSHQSDGVLQVWKDDQMILDRKGPNTYNDKVGPYFKMGVYKSDWKYNPGKSNTDTRTIYFDEVRIANGGGNYRTVAPAT